MGRVEEYYRYEDGVWSTNRDRNAILVDAGDVVRAARRATSVIPAQFFIGTARHETNMARNERDTEENGFQSWGIFQLSKSERLKAGFPEADLLDVEDSATIFAVLMEKNFRILLDASGLDEETALRRGILGYLAWSHNTGLAHKDGRTNALESIQRDGCDWNAFMNRNQGYEWGRKISAYGKDCIDGGADWRPEFDLPLSEADGGYEIEPAISATNRSRLRLLALLAIALVVIAKLLGRRGSILGG